MDKKNQFMEELKDALKGNVSEKTFSDTVKYYEDYISSEVASGKSIDDVINMLGNGRVIARTIIDTADVNDGGYADTSYSETVRDEEQEKQVKKEIFWLKFKIVAFIIAVLFVVILLVAIAFKILWVLLPFILVIWLAAFIYNFVNKS